MGKCEDRKWVVDLKKKVFASKIIALIFLKALALLKFLLKVLQSFGKKLLGRRKYSAALEAEETLQSAASILLLSSLLLRFCSLAYHLPLSQIRCPKNFKAGPSIFNKSNLSVKFKSKT